MKRLPLIFLTIFLVQPSYTNGQGKKDSVHVQIQGKWAWIETVPSARGGIKTSKPGAIKLPQKTTPLTCTCERTLTITDDKILSHYSGNDSLIQMNHYEFWHGIQDSSGYSLRENAFSKDRIRIMIDSHILEGDVDVRGDTLTVSWWVWDGGGTDYYFKKIK